MIPSRLFFPSTLHNQLLLKNPAGGMDLGKLKKKEKTMDDKRVCVLNGKLRIRTEGCSVGRVTHASGAREEIGSGISEAPEYFDRADLAAAYGVPAESVEIFGWVESRIRFWEFVMACFAREARRSPGLSLPTYFNAGWGGKC